MARNGIEPKSCCWSQIPDVDYDRYADAEAALGWVNVHARIKLERAANPASLARSLLDWIEQALTQASIRIAHLKLFARNAFGYSEAAIAEMEKKLGSKENCWRIRPLNTRSRSIYVQLAIQRPWSAS